MTEKELIKKARKHLSEICKDPKKFRTSIPVCGDDSDILFSKIFDLVKKKNDSISSYQLKINILRREVKKLRENKVDSKAESKEKRLDEIEREKFKWICQNPFGAGLIDYVLLKVVDLEFEVKELKEKKGQI